MTTGPATDSPFTFDEWMSGGDSASGEPGEYTDWVGLVREILRPRLDTLEDFLPDAVLKDSDLGKLVLQWIELGKTQLHAPCNNRRALLSKLNNEIRMIDTYIEAGAIPPDHDEQVSYDFRETIDYLEITGADSEEVLRERQELLREQARVLHEGMQRDKEEGHFEDYTELARPAGRYRRGPGTRGQGGACTCPTSCPERSPSASSPSRTPGR